ncbi:YajQ family cyclic di-GMP-binding protein [Brachybacterium paraconglomeratum]|uniref:YajQ family cyclic di-GMP-binding protein n=1 Tax=Brachybacterium paraconglomeratum TaxID=173362 RepID=UPI0031EC864C
MADSSFDIVSKLDRQEIDNAVNQAVKEVGQRYDFRGTGASITLTGDEIVMVANAEERVLAVLDVLQSKLIRRGISLKALEVDEPKQSGKEMRLAAALKEGISTEDAKKISKLIREEGPKAVKARIEGDELRVSSKSRDDLQTVISLLKGKDLDVALQFVNYR